MLSHGATDNGEPTPLLTGTRAQANEEDSEMFHLFTKQEDDEIFEILNQGIHKNRKVTE